MSCSFPGSVGQLVLIEGEGISERDADKFDRLELPVSL